MQLTDWLIARNKKKRERAAQRTQTRAERLKPVEDSLTAMIVALREQSARREQDIAALQARVKPYQGIVDGMPGQLTREEILKRQRAAEQDRILGIVNNRRATNPYGEGIN